jgi:hypothetical protein
VLLAYLSTGGAVAVAVIAAVLLLLGVAWLERAPYEVFASAVGRRGT